VMAYNVRSFARKRQVAANQSAKGA
jgi:hypothetical protein